ncbi:hypothetical protein [Sphingomonas koreensis]
MIEHLRVGTSAYFYRRKKPLSAAAIARLFRDVRDAARKPKNDLFRLVRQENEGSLYSAISFSHERAPGFLTRDASRYDRVHGFLLLVERGDYVAIFKSGLELPPSFVSEYLTPANPSSVEAAIATAEAVFERVQVKSTSISKEGVKKKVLEASDLANSMPMASAGGFFTQAYSVKRDDGHYSATPSTARIAQRGDRTEVEIAINWAATVIDQLAAAGDTASSFIRNFARRLDLSNLAKDTAPIQFAIDVPQLTELLLAEEPVLRLVRKNDATEAYHRLGAAEVQALLDGIDDAFPVHRGRPDYRIKRGNRSIGTLRFNKGRIALRHLDLASFRGLDVESEDTLLGEDANRRPFMRYIDRENLFTILFSEPSIAYINGELFRNEAMLDGGANFTRHLLPIAALASATSEKGTFTEQSTEFSPNSVFRTIVDTIAANDDILVCDDLGDEWADFIGLNTQSRPPSINFYHGKHGEPGLGASDFHVAVSQAQKNLGRLELRAADMGQKYQSWAQSYESGKGVKTNIAKLVRGGPMQNVEARVSDVRGAPDAVRRVYIVTSSLSKSAVEDAFSDIAGGARPKPYFVQLYWLLTGYFSQCADMGAVGFIICRT